MPVRRRGCSASTATSSIPAFSLLVDAIHEAGAAAALQITDRWHTHFPYRLHELSLAALQAMVEQYARGAERALRAGFDAINIQGAHGWPLARFLSPLYNDRTDQYREPTRVPAMVVRRLRAVVGPQVPLFFRLCLDEGALAACTRRRCATAIAPQLEDAGVDVLDLTFGAGPIAKDVKAYLGTEPLYSPAGERADLYRWVRERLSVPLLGRSRITDPAVALQMVEDGAVDLLGIGRQLLADPDFPRKTAQHRWDAINRCIGCDVCLAQTVLRGRTLSCPINPTLGREVEQQPACPARAGAPARARRQGQALRDWKWRGGWPAGATRSPCGSKPSAPGGLLRQVAGLPALHLRDLASYGELCAAGACRAGGRAAAGHARDGRAPPDGRGETVVLATGARPCALASASPHEGPPWSGMPPISPGRGPSASAWSSSATARGRNLRSRSPGRATGCGCSSGGRAPPRGLRLCGPSGARPSPTTWPRPGVHIVGLVDAVQPTAGGVMLCYRNGHRERLPTDTVLVAGRQASDEPTHALVPPGWDVYQVGDCVAPLGIAEALRRPGCSLTQLSH